MAALERRRRRRAGRGSGCHRGRGAACPPLQPSRSPAVQPGYRGGSRRASRRQTRARRGQGGDLRQRRGPGRGQHHLRRPRQPAAGAQPQRPGAGEDVGLRRDDEQVGARRVPPSQVRQTTQRVHAAEAAGAHDPVLDDELARHRQPGVERVGEALDAHPAPVQLGDQLRQLDGEVAAAREPGAVEGRAPVTGVRSKTHPDIDPAPESASSRAVRVIVVIRVRPPFVVRPGRGTDPMGNVRRGRARVRSGGGGRVAVPRPVVTTRARPARPSGRRTARARQRSDPDQVARGSSLLSRGSIRRAWACGSSPCRARSGRAPPCGCAPWPG